MNLNNISDKDKLLDKDKLIIVCYLGCEDINRPRVVQMLNEVKNMLERTFDNSVKIIVIPLFTTRETHLEFINTNDKTLSDDKLSRFEIACQSIKADINKYINYE